MHEKGASISALARTFGASQATIMRIVRPATGYVSKCSDQNYRGLLTFIVENIVDNLLQHGPSH